MKTYLFVNKADITLKNSDSIPVGAKIELRWENQKPIVKVEGGPELKLRTSTVAKMMGKKQPSETTLMKWDNDGYSKTIMGKKVEPDGVDEYGSPSWLLTMGMI